MAWLGEAPFAPIRGLRPHGVAMPQPDHNPPNSTDPGAHNPTQRDEGYPLARRPKVVQGVEERELEGESPYPEVEQRPGTEPPERDQQPHPEPVAPPPP